VRSITGSGRNRELLYKCLTSVLHDAKSNGTVGQSDIQGRILTADGECIISLLTRVDAAQNHWSCHHGTERSEARLEILPVERPCSFQAWIPIRIALQHFQPEHSTPVSSINNSLSMGDKSFIETLR